MVRSRRSIACAFAAPIRADTLFAFLGPYTASKLVEVKSE